MNVVLPSIHVPPKTTGPDGTVAFTECPRAIKAVSPAVSPAAVTMRVRHAPGGEATACPNPTVP